MHSRFAGRPISPYVLAVAATHCGRHDDAFELLKRADDERDPSAPEMMGDVSFHPLHHDPRWPVLVAKMRAAPARRRAVPAAMTCKAADGIELQDRQRSSLAEL